MENCIFFDLWNGIVFALHCQHPLSLDICVRPNRIYPEAFRSNDDLCTNRSYLYPFLPDSIKRSLGLEPIRCYLGISCFRNSLEIISVQISKLVFNRILSIYGLACSYCYLPFTCKSSNRSINMVISRWNILYWRCHLFHNRSAGITSKRFRLP